MTKEKKFDNLEEGMQYIEQALFKMKISNKSAMRVSLTCESAITQLLKHLPDNDNEYRVRVKDGLIRKEIVVEAKGAPFTAETDESFGIDDIFKEKMGGTDFVSKLIGRAYKDSINFTNKRGVNQAKITVEVSDKKEFIETFGALILGCLVGLILNKCCSRTVCDKIDFYFFDLIKTMFMNALRIVVGPIVFFSIASCMSRFTNMSELGRLGAKTMLMYLITTLFAIAIGFTLFTIFPTGDPSLVQYVNGGQTEEDEEADEELEEVKESVDSGFSIRNSIADLVPDNLLTPFIEANLLQIIFLGVLLGLCAGKCGNRTSRLEDLIEDFNALFMKVTEVITKVIPLAIFCAVSELVMLTGVEVLKVLLRYALLVVGGMLCMIVFYCIFLVLVARVNPIIFLKKFSKAMMTAFAVSSGAATMPTSMSSLRKMGVDNKIVSFSIPLGANVNMDGSCMVFIITVLFMCRVYNINMTGGMLFSTVLSIIMLSLGSPCIAGADLVMLAILIRQVGVPIEAIGLIMGIDAIFDMVQAVSNTTGDAVVAICVAKSEEMLDEEKYYA